MPLFFSESTPVKSNINQNGKDSHLGRKYNRRVVVALYNAKGEIGCPENKSAKTIISKTAHPQLKRALLKE